MRKALLLLCVTFISLSFKAQLTVTNTAPYNTPNYLVNNVLLGQGVSASNITFTGDANQIGYFSNGLAGATNPLGIDAGIVLSSGNVNDIPNAGNLSTDFTGAGDPDLLSIAQTIQPGITSSQDAAALEFDFVPQGDTVEFRFVFASDEYLTWINSNFNDIFAFFLSGPGYTGPYAAPAAFPGGATNLALVPGTASPITISTIYVDPSQTPTSMNGSYFINNPNENTFDFNGYTTVISIKFHVNCNDTYHFKFAVSDCQDGTLDTGVFMEAGSFSSDAVQVNVVSATGDSTVIEGCADANIFFTRPDTAGTLTVHYSIGGTAINGTDYTNIADSITFAAGQDSAVLNITPIADAILEGQETITISVTTINVCGDTIISTGTIYILDIPNMLTETNDTTLLCPENTLQISVQASNALAPYTYVWTDSGGNPIGTNNDTITVPGLVTDTFYVSVTDSCNLVTINDTVIVTVNTPIVSFVTNNDTTLFCPNHPINLVASPSDGVTPYNYNWTPGGAGSSVNVTPAQTTTYYITATDACGNTETDSVIATVNYTPFTLNTTGDISLACPNLTYPISAAAIPNGGTAPFTYNWGAISADTDSLINTNVSSDQIITVTGSDFCGFNANSSLNVSYLDYTPMNLVTEPVDSTCADEIVFISAIASSGVAPYSYSWSNGNNGESVEYSSSVIGENIVTVTATDECDLQFSTDMIVNIINCKVDLVNVITPNGDNKNDFLTFKGIKNFPKNRLVVSNRWGRVIFEADNYQNNWNGGDASEGTYFYILELNNSKEVIHKGTFTLLK